MELVLKGIRADGAGVAESTVGENWNLGKTEGRSPCGEAIRVW